MSTHLAHSPNIYRQSAVLTATPEGLVLLLYDGARRFLHQGSVALAAGRIELAHGKLRRGEEIIDHLLATLDHEQGGEIAVQLDAIYRFCLRYINEARVARDPAKVETVGRLLEELREAWAAICG